MLVVLALIGAVAGATGLAVGGAVRGEGAQGEAAILATRMRRASEEALLAGEPVALAWSEHGYRFLALADGAWVPHPAPLLGEPKALGSGLRFEGEAAGAFAVTAAALPAGDEPLILRLGAEGGDPDRAVTVEWDGATATVGDPGE